MTSNSEPFRTQVPNIIDDLGLDPFERALYVHYKRTCGENPQGYSNETVQTIHLKLKMGAGQVSEARKSLVERGLIRMQNTHPVVVTIIDIWDLNRAYYGLEREYRPDVDGWTVEQVKVWLCDMSSDIHIANVSSHNDNDIPSSSEQGLTEYNEHSPSEQDQPTVNVSIHKDNNMSSNIHKAKQRIVSESIESNPTKESKRETPAPIPKKQREITIPAFKVFVEITEYHAINAHWRSEMARIVGEKSDDLEFWRRVIIGWTGKYPSKHNVEGMLDFYKRREIPGYRQSPNGIHKEKEVPLDPTSAALTAALQSRARPYKPREG